MEFDNNYFSNIVNDVYEDMRVEFNSSDPVINEILFRILSQQGKGVRPVFMVLVAELVGGSWESLRRAATVVEAIHVTSLLHDDVIDGAELRRGVPTLNVVHSNKISILFGDHIFANAILIANEIMSREAVSVVHEAIKRMLVGEISDTLNGEIITEDKYLKIISDKTASLFAAAGELGVILSGIDGNERIWARELGEALGMSFQIIDDTLDYNGDEELMGKPVLMDIMSGNMTLPLIHSIRGMNSDQVMKILSGDKEAVEKISEIVRKNGGIEYAYKKAHEYLEKAREILSRFGNKKMVPMFDKFFDFLMVRNY